MLKPPSTKVKVIQALTATLLVVALWLVRATVIWLGLNWLMDSFTERNVSWLSAFGLVLLLGEVKYFVRNQGKE